MDIIHISSKLTNSEREILLNYDCETKTWYMDTTIIKYYNKAKRRGWKQTAEYRYNDETVCGGRFEAPEYAITIRSTEKKQMSDKQMQNLISDDEED